MKSFAKIILFTASVLCFVQGGSAFALQGNLVIVTSFPNDTSVPYKAAFEEKYPQVTVEILNKKTTAGIKYLQETAANNQSDLFWASAPDAFEVLKGDGLLSRYQTKVKGIPEKIGAFPINDPDGYYKGFAASGYGIMWNTRYMKAKKLPVATEWSDLAKPVYHGHVGISAPSRSGTTHLTVETVLQGRGWEDGWALWKSIAGNLKTVTERSFGVPDGVNSGQFGLGIVIDWAGVKFDLDLSKGRYNVVNSLFDVMITYRLEDLVDAVKAIQDAEAALGDKNHPEAQDLIAQARALVAETPISAEQASRPEFNAIFKKKRKKATTKVTGRQAEVEQAWDEQVRANYAQAESLARKAENLL